ncbi:MAG: bifunctional 5,10-methylenetetrahydrofolate dehydrogenase/5,10-methenyltetrahydrofolate cyclohydrolase, partial [Candidatus Fermentibacterota bacterium]
MAEVLSGKKLARSVRRTVAAEVEGMEGPPPGLAVVLVGEDEASRVYVSYKEKACRKAGIRSTVVRMPREASRGELMARIDDLNSDDTVDGLLVQLPLPDHLSASEVASAVLPEKDVDGFHPQNVGRLWRGEDGLFPCTPTGIMALLEHAGIDPEGMRAVIVGRSDIVGKPLAAMLLAANATVTLAHSRTRDLPGLASQADLLVSAVGVPGIIGPGHVKAGAVVVDVGISRTEDGLAGDV